MPAPTGTNLVGGRVGVAEDIHDMIYNISPTEVPVSTAAKRLKATNVLHQWQVDTLANAAVNSFAEGDDFTAASAAPTVMLANFTNISKKQIVVSRTANTVKKYGRKSEIGYLITKQGKELKRDIELMLLGAQVSVNGTGTTARVTAGYRNMIVNRVDATGSAKTTAGTVVGYSGAGIWGAVTDGSLVSFVEADLRNALELAWQDGGDPSMIVTNTVQKRRMAQMAGATAFDGFPGKTTGSGQGALIGGVDVYVSDYGSHKVVLDRFIGQTAVLCLDPEYIGIAWLDPIQIEDIAKTGDAEKKHIVCEWASVLMNPDAHAQVIGCNVTI